MPAENVVVLPLSVTLTVMLVFETVPVTICGLGGFVPGAPIDNPYFPLVPGTTFHGGGTTHDLDTGETATERDEDFVTFQTKVIAGVTVRVARPTSSTWEGPSVMMRLMSQSHISRSNVARESRPRCSASHRTAATSSA